MESVTTRGDWDKAYADWNKTFADMKMSNADMDKARADMDKAREAWNAAAAYEEITYRRLRAFALPDSLDAERSSQ